MVFVLVAIIVAIAFFDQCSRSIVISQDRITPQLALARTCVSETGFEGDERECAAIYAALLWRAEHRYHGSSFVYAAQTHSAEVFNTGRRDHRAYIAHLRPDGREPLGWPTTSSFVRGDSVIVRPGPRWTGRIRRGGTTYRDGWLRLYAAAGEILAGRIESACPRVPVTWGMSSPSSADYQRAISNGLERLDCRRTDATATRNAFWDLPVDVD